MSDQTLKDIDLAFKALEERDELLDNIRAEIKEKIEQEEFARSVFRHEEKDTAKSEQCTGSIMAYNNVIKLIDKYKAESEEISDRNLKMWHDIYEEEKRKEGSDKE